MKSSTFMSLATELRPYIIAVSHQKCPRDTFQMDGFHQMYDLHVPFVGLREGPHMTL
jgi:hypothetical protein